VSRTKLVTRWATHQRPDGKISVRRETILVSAVPEWVGTLGFLAFAGTVSVCVLGADAEGWSVAISLLSHRSPGAVPLVVLSGILGMVGLVFLWDQIWRHFSLGPSHPIPLDGVVRSSTACALCDPDDVLPDGSLVKDHLGVVKWRPVQDLVYGPPLPVNCNSGKVS
jgi:hypothetical protein